MSKAKLTGQSPVALALLQVAVVAAVIEWFHPYFFLQDDNRTFLLPQLMHNWRAFAQGQVAEFNFYQYCGMPALSNGQAGTLYIPNYIATAISLFVFGGPWAAIDVLTVVHLLIGAAGGYFALRQIGLGRMPASWAGAASVLNAFVIYVGNSWPGVTAAAAYLPWAIGLAVRLAAGGTGAAGGLIAVHALWILNGHPQFFLYGVTFEAIAFVTTVRMEGRPALAVVLRYLVACAASILITAPLLLPMFQQMALSAERSSRLPWREFVAGAYQPHLWLVGLLFPFSEIWFDRTPSTEYLAQVSAYASHVSYAVVAFAAAAVVCIWRRRLAPDLHRQASLLLGLATLSAFWSAGAFSLPLHFIPVYNRMRWPFKLQLYTALFIAFLAACGLEHVLRGRSAGRRRILFAATAVLTVLNCAALYAGMQIKTFRRSVGVLPAVEASPGAFARGRVASVAYEWGDLDAPGSLGFNYPTLFGIQAFGGYDPLATRLNRRVALDLNHMSSLPCDAVTSNLQHLRHWAVAYYVVSPRAEACHSALESLGMRLIEQDARRRIYADKRAAPPISWEDNTTGGLDCRLGINDIECRSFIAHPARLRMRFAAHPYFRSFTDGREAGLSVADSQIVLTVPPGSHSIRLAYRDEMTLLGFKIAAATLVVLAAYSLCVGTSYLRTRKSKRAAARA